MKAIELLRDVVRYFNDRAKAERRDAASWRQQAYNDTAQACERRADESVADATTLERVITVLEAAQEWREHYDAMRGVAIDDGAAVMGFVAKIHALRDALAALDEEAPQYPPTRGAPMATSREGSPDATTHPEAPETLP